MAYSIRNKKKGKYTEKIDSSYLDQVYLETIDSQILLENPVVINGITYDSASGTDTNTHKYNQTLANVLAVLNSSGGKYKLSSSTTSHSSTTPTNIVAIWESTDGGTTWTLVNSTTVNNVANASSSINATYATKIGTSTTHPSIGSSTQPVYVDSNGTITAATSYANAHVAEADADGNGNNIITTYATKQELEDAELGLNTSYVTSSTRINQAGETSPIISYVSQLVVAKTSSTQSVSLEYPHSESGTAWSGNIPILPSGNVALTDLKVGDMLYLTDADKCDWFVGTKTESGGVTTVTFYRIEADTPDLTNYVQTSSSTLGNNNIILGAGNKTVKTSNYTISTTAITESGTGSATALLTSSAVVGTITNKFGTLDVSDLVATPTSGTAGGPSRTLATLYEEDGKIKATFQDISITKSQISNFPTFTLNGSAVANPSWYAPTTAGSTGQVYGLAGGATMGGWTYISSGYNDASTPTLIQSVGETSPNRLSLGDSGITPGTYSAIKVNAKGIAINGAQMVVFATGLNDSSLDNLAEGGIGIIYE